MAVETLGRFRAVIENSVNTLEIVAGNAENQVRSLRAEIAHLEGLAREIESLLERLRDVWGLDQPPLSGPDIKGGNRPD